MPLYDYKCPACGRVEKDVKDTMTPSGQHRCYCVSCAQIGDMSSTVMTRLPCAPAFTVQGGTPKFHQ